VHLPPKKVKVVKTYQQAAVSGGLAFICYKLQAGASGPWVKALSFVCWAADLVASTRLSSEDYDRVQVSYNPRTGEVILRRTRFLLISTVNYRRGRSDTFLMDGGGRLCALGISGWGNPYNVMFCGPARRL
jgi:hypothetical protein